MPEWAVNLGSQILPYVTTIVVAVMGYVAVRIKSYFDKKINTETKKQVIEDTVKYVQQVYEDLSGKEKLNKALETSIQWLNEKGINITEVEATILIEAAIKGFKEGWKSEPKEIEAPVEQEAAE